MTRLHIYLTSLVATLSTVTWAQDQYFIYGKVHTDDNQVYEGAIRWGKEEVYWTDIFNGSKEWNDNLRYLTDRDRQRLDDRNGTWYSWSNSFFNFTSHPRGQSRDYVHQFACQFGEISSLRPVGSKAAELKMRNGTRVSVLGEGYNDIGLNIRVYDPEVGEITIHWNRLRLVEFMDTPSRLEHKFGAPLYGTVEAFGEKFTGLIQWDHDERLTTDKLDGDSEDGDVAIPFGNIRAIEKRGNKSLVTLKSGRELLLGGGNDVSSGHRGVIIETRDFPQIDVPWSEFKKVVFEDAAPSGGMKYADFKQQTDLTGKVITHHNETYSGRIVYDLDESTTYELLQGKRGEVEYTIPFRDIRKISTKGEHRCEIELKSGLKIMLDESQDVGTRNHGLLVFRSTGTESKYLLWSDVSEITFH